MATQIARRTSHASAALVLCVGLVVFGGCRSSQQTAMTNPFMSADRVPPPQSRIPAVGTAVPQYSTDALPPLPTMQPMQPMQPLGALPPSSDITPIPSDGSFARASEPSSSRIAMAGDEGGIRIPTDESATRFAAAPPAIPASTPVTIPIAQPAASQPQSLYTASNIPVPTPVVPTTTQPLATAPAINNWPPADAGAPQVTINPVMDGGRASGLFRDPVVPAQAPALYNQPSTQPSAVPATSPRVALPGAAEMIREEVVPGTINTTSYQVGMAGGEAGQPLTIPPPGYVPASFLPDTTPTPLGDGFRPRGSIRSNPTGNLNPADVPTIRVTPG
ncbi:hypothetical protein [Aeoliella sp. SH292]|uniref:hypothetical protein n=1 Tax=Aeoliella sp. SH292 TaxID=3454464 RepID=UPI003F9BC580